MEVGPAAQFPVGLVRVVLGRLDPVALIKAHDADAGLTQTPGNGAAGSARPDNQHVGLFVVHWGPS